MFFFGGGKKKKKFPKLGVFPEKGPKRAGGGGGGVKILRVIVEVDVILSSAILHFSKLLQMDNRVALCNTRTFRISIKYW